MWLAVAGVGVVASDTVAVKENIPDAVGVPLITPVAVFSANPAGSEFTGTDQV